MVNPKELLKTIEKALDEGKPVIIHRKYIYDIDGVKRFEEFEVEITEYYFTPILRRKYSNKDFNIDYVFEIYESISDEVYWIARHKAEDFLAKYLGYRNANEMINDKDIYMYEDEKYNIEVQKDGKIYKCVFYKHDELVEVGREIYHELFVKPEIIVIDC